MTVAVVIAPYGIVYTVIVTIMIFVYNVHFVTEPVVSHICVHIGLVMSVMDRCGTPVVRREVIPVPGRVPGPVAGSHQMCIYYRCGDEYRLYNVACAVDIG